MAHRANGPFVPKPTRQKVRELYPDPCDVFQRMGFFTSRDELQDKGTEWEIRSNGGLTIAKKDQDKYGSWYCHGEEYGGGVIEAWLWAGEEKIVLPKEQRDWTAEHYQQYAFAIKEMLAEKGIDLDANYNIIYTDDATSKLITQYLDEENPGKVFTAETLKQVEAMLVEDRVKRYTRSRPASRHLWDGTSDYSTKDLTRYERALDDAIYGFATRGEATLFYGPGGTGKSYIVLEMAIALILCRQVLDQLGTTAKTGHVIYIAAETDPDFINRVENILKRINATPEQVEEIANKLHYFSGRTNPVHLADEQWAISFTARILHRYERQGMQPDLIIIDTLRAATACDDIEENGNRIMGFVMRNAVMLGAALGNAAVVVIHHPTKEGKTFSGGGSLSSNVNKVFVAEQLKGGLVIVQTEKDKLSQTNKDRIFLAAQFKSNEIDEAYLVPADKDKASTAKAESKKAKSLTDNQLAYLQVVLDACDADDPPFIKELSKLLTAQVGKDRSDYLGNNRKRTLLSLVKRGYIAADGDLEADDTVLTITLAGRKYMQSHVIQEEEL